MAQAVSDDVRYEDYAGRNRGCPGIARPPKENWMPKKLVVTAAIVAVMCAFVSTQEQAPAPTQTPAPAPQAPAPPATGEPAAPGQPAAPARGAGPAKPGQQTGNPDPGVNFLVIVDNPHVRVLQVTVQPGAVRRPHVHNDVTFHMLVPVTGSLELTIEKEPVVTTVVGQAYYMVKGQTHSFMNKGSAAAQVIELFIKPDPATTPAATTAAPPATSGAPPATAAPTSAPAPTTPAPAPPVPAPASPSPPPTTK